MSSDSSQEQIRKHYKKIAVLVHPDKNKQAGAEEAFKILQRSFELIGEPVGIYNFTAISVNPSLNHNLQSIYRKIAESMIKV